MNLCCGLLRCRKDPNRRRNSFFSAVSSAGEDEDVARRVTFYGIRQRIPTCIDLLRHPSSEWWSDCRLDSPHVVEDLGPEPRLLARTFKVKVIGRELKSANELEYFNDTARVRPLQCALRYVVLQLLLGDKMIVSIGEVADCAFFDSLFSRPELIHEFKLIVNPANVRIPWEVKGPKESSPIAQFFGEDNCSVKRKEIDSFKFAVITIDVYARFMIRSFLPKLAFQPGRISDYILVDYEHRTILTGFRIVATSVLRDLLLLKKKKNHRYSFTSFNYF